MTTNDSRSAQWLKSNLATIGSAAVFTVYATGWARTKSAADLLDEQSDRRLPPRRPAATVAVGQVDGTPMARPAEASAPANAAPSGAPSEVATNGAAGVAPATSSDAGRATASPATAHPAPAASASAPTSTAATSVAATPSNAAPAASTSATTSAPTSTTATAATPTTASALGATPPSTPAPSTTTAAPVTSASNAVTTASAMGADVSQSSSTRPPDRVLATTAVATVPASAGAQKGAQAPAGALKDGVYSGWGTSRHGDIEAYVEIKDGRIKSTFISECLTQYSCSWIAKLPGWVVENQSAETDYISGATQSSNAFYYAVVAALKKAR